MKGWRRVLALAIAAVVGTGIFLCLLILAHRLRQWVVYDEARVEAQIERRVRLLEERVEKLERR